MGKEGLKRGFVTIATGNEHYFDLARNLLRSYKLFAKEQYPFAIICDHENSYTEEFDDVVILKDAKCTYMDKIELLSICPYEENIFIDADCLVYGDINIFWDKFANAPDFCCFGSALPLDSKKGLFKAEDTADWKDKIHFVTHLHGVIYFIRRGGACRELLETCKEIISHYYDYYFEGFPDPSDESVFALAMAIHNFKPVIKDKSYYIFLPVAKRIHCNILNGELSYTTEREGNTKKGLCLHWANVNTKGRAYKSECFKLNKMVNNKKSYILPYMSYYIIWTLQDTKVEISKQCKKMIYYIKQFVYKLMIKWKKIK